MFKLIADSTCDLSDEILEKYQISIAPLSIIIEDETPFKGDIFMMQMGVSVGNHVGLGKGVFGILTHWITAVGLNPC